MLTPSELARYDRDGYAIAREVITENELKDLRAASDRLTLRAREFSGDTFVGSTFFNMHRDANPFAKNINSVPIVAGQIRRVTYPYAICSVFNQMRVHPKILSCVQALLGPDLVQIVNQVNFNPPGSGSGWGWHQDYRFRKPGIENLMHDFVQTILAIDLCSPKTGGLRLVPGSFRLGDLQLDTDNEHAESFFNPETAVQPELQPGDLILFNSHVIHGSTANQSACQRRVYINGYARGTATIGMPVLKRGVPTSKIIGRMEYEGDQESLPKASKYS